MDHKTMASVSSNNLAPVYLYLHIKFFVRFRGQFLARWPCSPPMEVASVLISILQVDSIWFKPFLDGPVLESNSQVKQWISFA